jgi:PAS domain S-box-containing protein
MARKSATNGAAAAKPDMIRWLFENSSDLMHVAAPGGILKLVNPAWERVLGWTEAELIDTTILDLFHPDDLPGVRERVRSMAEGEARESQVRLKRKDGEWLWMACRSQKLADGMLIVTMRDATAERAREVELADGRRTRKMLGSSAGIGTWSYEPLENGIWWSDELLALIGHKASDIATPEGFFEILHPEERGMVERALDLGVHAGEPAQFEHRLKHGDGGWVTVRATFHTEPRGDGLFALKGISQDITELAEARDGARRGEQLMRQLIEAAPFAVAMMDREANYMVVSPRWAATFGLDAREDLGRTITEIFPKVPKRFLDAHERVMGGDTVSRHEERFTDRHGRRHWLRWEGSPWRDANGEVGGMVVYADDISALARARREAQTNAKRLKLALKAAEAGVYEIDHVNKTFWCSPEFRKLTGKGKASYATATELRYPGFHPDDLEHVRQSFRNLHAGNMKSGEAFEARIVRPGGEERWVRVLHNLKVGRNGRWQKAVGLIHDFDARKRQELALIEAQEAAEAAAEAKAAFLANMSHEIRTPMNGVMGVLHLLKKEQLTEDGRSMLEEALSCGQMLAELLNDVIDFSKIEAGRLELAVEPVDPKALVEGVVRLLRPQAQGKGIEINIDCACQAGWVRSDPVRLRQALFNLVGNAVKFTEAGSVTVRCMASAGGRLRFEVKDTGVGIPAHVQDRIFQRFDQGDASTTRKFGGSGLGLAITKKLAEMMSGEVGFTSVEGQGSTFWMEVAAEPAQAETRRTEMADDVLSGLRLLVVEDNATNRMIASKMLEHLGASVETAADGFLGVEAAARGGFDLILMDVQMPGIDGLEAVRRIRALGGEVARTPVVALTANVLSHQRQEYLEAGMDGVVGKPISPAALVGEIARLMTTEDEPEEGEARQAS